MRLTHLLLIVLFAETLSATTMCTDAPNAAVNKQAQLSTADARQPSASERDINAFLRQKYNGCRIVDKDMDDGLLEVKIHHHDVEKVALFCEGRWLRTLWELRRTGLPEDVLSAFRRSGFKYEDIDDNDNMVVDTPYGRFYAVQAKRNGREYIYIVSRNGEFARRYTSDNWDDGRLHGDDGSRNRWDVGDSRFNDVDDEWGCCHNRRYHRHHHRDYDNGEDRFDEGDDEWPGSEP